MQKSFPVATLVLCLFVSTSGIVYAEESSNEPATTENPVLMPLKNESRKTQSIKRAIEFSSRRFQALKRRSEDKQSLFDSPVNPGSRVDLSERELPRARMLRDQGDPAFYERIDDGMLLRRRTLPGNRKDGVEPPACFRRDGLRLITCMQALKIEITPETVDEDTWKIFERLYTR